MRLLLISVFLLLCHCSPVKQYHADPLILDNQTIQFLKNEKVLSGTGRVLFNQPLFGLYSKELYFIKAQLFNEDSSLVLHSHFTGFVKKDGIKIFFTRNKNNLIIKAATPAYPDQHLSIKNNYFIKNQNLEAHIQVQNGTDDFINIKIWDVYINPSEHLKKSTPFLLRQNLIIDSESAVFYSTGKGMLWGIELNKARLIKIFRNSVNQ